MAGSKKRTHAAFLTPAATTTVADISDCDHEQSDNDLLASTSDAQAKSLETLCKHCGEIDLDGLSTQKSTQHWIKASSLHRVTDACPIEAVEEKTSTAWTNIPRPMEAIRGKLPPRPC
ncbi:hypothetical protein LCER1_G003067 [Lachnellula cervina]|uniref:Uncharacterized protein n=1 Tax=Lachnellula cervina TaxID=1316786 RepID=A0A7D8UU95_9HELO|nr:hypothetical protein LCER1_G003067 [Lachnellula cervina]